MGLEEDRLPYLLRPSVASNTAIYCFGALQTLWEFHCPSFGETLHIQDVLALFWFIA